MAAANGADTAPEFRPSISAATDEAWHSRVAVIDIVGAEAGAHQFLEQVGFLVRSFGRPKTGERFDALFIADFDEALGGEIERFFPRRLAEMS